jgi:membrane protease YdiL (CAAX protease family)
MSSLAQAWPIIPARLALSPVLAFLATIGVAVLACVVSVAVGLANTAYFDFVNGFIGARETVARGVLFSSWLVLIGGLVVVWRPARFGFQIGDLRSHWRLVTGSLVAGALGTAALLTITGTTPYSDASLFIEVVVVPVTEELVFRAVLLTVLVAVFALLHPPRTATLLAVAVNAIAFGLAHIGNAMFIDLAFVLPQVAFASVLGLACAGLMAVTRSVYPAILLHAVVNAVVVLI